MQTERPTGSDLPPTAKPSPRMGAKSSGRGGLTGPRARAIWCLVLLVGTALTGLLLHGQIDDGGALETGSVGLRILHVIFAAGLTVTIVWHLVDKRRSLLAFAKRRNGRSLRCLLADTVLVGLLVASLATAVAGDGRSQLAHHMAVSIVLAVAYAWHGGRRMTRRRRTSQRLPVEAKP